MSLMGITCRSVHEAVSRPFYKLGFHTSTSALVFTLALL